MGVKACFFQEQLLTMAGDAPAASNVFAMKSMDTKFVMHCINGFSLLTLCQRAQADSLVAFNAAMGTDTQFPREIW